MYNWFLEPLAGDSSATDEALLRKRFRSIRLRLLSLGSLTAGASRTEGVSAKLGLLKWNSDPETTER